MSASVDTYFLTALEIVKQAGLLIKNAIKKKKSEKNIETKSSAIDFVTETDRAVETFIISKLSEAFPDHKFIGEESAPTGKRVDFTDVPTWIVDPIDGTMNFVHTNPNCCISLGLSVKKEIEAGIIFNPILDLMFTAKKGCGAYLNGERIHVSEEKNLSNALLMMECGTGRDPEKMKSVLGNFHFLINKVTGIRSWGSAAMDISAVAAGWADAYFEFGVHCWDMAAGVVLVREAGGVVINADGGPVDLMARKVLAASTRELAESLSSGLHPFHAPRD